MGKYRWSIATMVFISGIINYLDRSAFSVAAPFITKEFDLTPADMGLIFSSFFIGYALFNFIGGMSTDVFGPKKVYVVSVGLWSIFCGLIALAFNYVSLFIFRIIFGLAEGPWASGANKIINNWFPRKERGTALGFVNCGNPLGGALAGPIVGFVALAWGWRASFVVIAILGLIWTVWWALSASDKPENHPKISAAERDEIIKGRDDAQLSETGADGKLIKQPVSYYLKQPTVLFTAIAFFSFNYTLFFFLTWFPSFLIQAKGLSLHDMSIVTMIPWMLGFISQALGGYVSDYIFKKTGNGVLARKIVIVTGLLVTAVCIPLAGIVSTTTGAVALMSCAVFFLYMTGPNYWAVMQETVPSHRIGTVGGLVHFLANTSGIIGPAVTGFIVQGTGSFAGGFILAGALALVGSLAMMFGVKPIRAVPAVA